MSLVTSLRPKLPHGFVRYIRLEDEWPLFSLSIHPNAAKTQAWAYLYGLPDMTKKPDAWVHLFHEWKRLERWCFHDGILGWYCVSSPQNVRFTRWLAAIGAEPKAEIPGRGIQYQKSILVDPSVTWSMLNMKDIAATMRPGRSGHA